MLDISYEKNPGSACALACYAMTARYYFPEVTFDDIAKISDWTPGYVVWAFKFWYWIMEKGIKVTDYDLIDLVAWADQGIRGLKDGISENEYNFIITKTKDINSYTEDIKKVLTHPNFTFIRQRPTWDNLVDAFNKNSVCEVVLDSRTLDQEEGFSLHRVEVLDINEKEITFHDPRKEARPARKESIELFKTAWLDKLEGPELCIYTR